LYPRGDPYESSDPVFGVKNSLIVDLSEVNQEIAIKYGVDAGSRMLTYDFVLASEEEAIEWRKGKARISMNQLGRDVVFINGLPVPSIEKHLGAGSGWANLPHGRA
jgi:hypothetical protein